MASRLRLGILGSDRGSNFKAIVDNIKNNNLSAEISVVISDKQSAMLDYAKKQGYKAVYINPKKFESTKEFNQVIIRELQSLNIDLVILAGYMRILSKEVVQAFKNKIFNIHPSLLPSFKGLHPHRQALDAGVKYSGCTVHFVTENLDAGPIICQAIVPVEDNDTENSLSAKILKEEHALYSKAISMFIEGLSIEGNKVVTSG